MLRASRSPRALLRGEEAPAIAAVAVRCRAGRDDRSYVLGPGEGPWRVRGPQDVAPAAPRRRHRRGRATGRAVHGGTADARARTARRPPRPAVLTTRPDRHSERAPDLVDDPEPVRRIRGEVPVDQVRSPFAADGPAWWYRTGRPRRAPRRPSWRISRSTVHRAIGPDRPVTRRGAAGATLAGPITPRPLSRSRNVARSPRPARRRPATAARAGRLLRGVVGRSGRSDALSPQGRADRLDPEPVPVRVDVVDDHPQSAVELRRAKNADAVLRISLARRSSRVLPLAARATPARSLGGGPRPVALVDLGLLDPAPQRLRR